MDILQLKINPTFRDFLPRPTDGELTRLEENILTEGRVIEPIVIWRDQIVDGHCRYAIWQKHKDKLPEPHIRCKTFSSEAAALRWMWDHQAGRRNWSTEQAAYARGKIYNESKRDHTANLRQGDFPMAQNELSGKPREKTQSASQTPPAAESPSDAMTTAEAVAKQTGSSPATVKRDATLAKAIDGLADSVRRAYLGGQLKATQAELIALSKRDADGQEQLARSVRVSQCANLSEALNLSKPAPTPAELRKSAQSKLGSLIRVLEHMKLYEALLPELEAVKRQIDTCNIPGGWTHDYERQPHRDRFAGVR